MRKYSKELLGCAFLILAVCSLLAMSCSWDIVTRGEILKADDAALEDLEVLEADALEESGELGSRYDIPDSLIFKVFSTITIDDILYDFVEMEVGELLEGEGAENDTLFVDHRP